MALENLELHTYEKLEDKVIPRGRSHWVTRLQDLNLEGEVLLHYNLAKDFLETVQHDDIPANQVATVMSTVSTILKELTKTQTELYNAERVKKMEAVLIATLKDLPTDVQDSFLDKYSKALNDV